MRGNFYFSLNGIKCAVAPAYQDEARGIQNFQGIFGKISYSAYEPSDIFCRQGQDELFLTQCVEGGKAEKLTDWMTPD